MEAIFRDVRSIAADERRMYESIVGSPLRDNQLVVIRVIEVDDELEDGSNRPPNEWNEEKNKRRRDLINKKIDGTISREERAELDELQREAIAYRDRVAPLPIEAAQRLYRELLEKKRRAEAEG